MCWRLFIIEDLQTPQVLQQLYPMRITGMRSADWRHHYRQTLFSISEARRRRVRELRPYRYMRQQP